MTSDPNTSARAMARLKAETREMHAATERTPLAQAMARGNLRRDPYVAQLSSFFPIHRALEGALAQGSASGTQFVFRRDMAKAPLLEADLRFFGALDAALPAELFARTTAAVAALESATLTEPCLLGRLYVMEGSTLGAAFLLPRIQEALGLGSDGTRYYTGYGPETMTHWKSFSDRMNAVLRTETEIEEAVAGAQRQFEMIGHLFDGIWAAYSATSEDDRPGPFASGTHPSSAPAGLPPAVRPGPALVGTG